MSVAVTYICMWANNLKTFKFVWYCIYVYCYFLRDVLHNLPAGVFAPCANVWKADCRPVERVVSVLPVSRLPSFDQWIVARGYASLWQSNETLWRGATPTNCWGIQITGETKNQTHGRVQKTGRRHQCKIDKKKINNKAYDSDNLRKHITAKNDLIKMQPIWNPDLDDYEYLVIK